jgi:hypothetical protein
MTKRKKKSDSITLTMPGTIGGAKIIFTEPTVVKGSHLTVTTYPDRSTTLEWDDEALMRDVREAILMATSNPPVTEIKPKRARAKKNG